MNPIGARRWWALAAINLAVLAITLDVTVLNLAIPTLAGALKATESQLQWFVTAYTLALAAGMLPAGLLGDRYGQRKVMASALLVFAAGSLACAYAPNPSFFIFARVVLALAGAAITVVALSVITVLFDEQERPRAIGIWSAANFIGLPLGPIIGGALLTHFWWGWIFLMNVPVALLAVIAVLFLVPTAKQKSVVRIDFLGLLLASAGLVGLSYGIIEAGNHGWGAANAIVPAVLGLLILVVFGFWERQLGRLNGIAPLVDLELFQSRRFLWGSVLTALGVIGLFGPMFTLPQYFQAIMGMNAQGAGFRLLPLIAGLVIGAIPGDRVASRIGPKLTTVFGFAIVAAGSLLGATMTPSSTDAFITLWTLLVGAGGGLAFTTAASTALSRLTAERSGIGSALLQAVIKLGPAFGSSILGSVLNATYQRQVDTTSLPHAAASAVKASVFDGVSVAHQLGSNALLISVRDAFAHGMDESLVIAAGIALVTLVLSLIFIPSRKASAPTQDGK